MRSTKLPDRCDREQDIDQLDGPPSRELLNHIVTCEACADAFAVCQFFRNDPYISRGELMPPRAYLVWRNAHSAQRRSRLDRVLFPLRAAVIAASVVCFAELLWLFGAFPLVRSWAAETAANMQLTNILSGGRQDGLLLSAIAISGSAIVALVSMLWPDRRRTRERKVLHSQTG